MSSKIEIHSPRTATSILKSPLSTSTTESPANRFFLKNSSSNRTTLASPTSAFNKSKNYFFPNTTRKEDAYNLSKEYNTTSQSNHSISKDLFNKTLAQSVASPRANNHNLGQNSPVRFGKSLPMLQLPIIMATTPVPGDQVNTGEKLESPKSTNRDSSSAMRDIEYKKQEGYIKKNPHISKFTNYLEALKMSDSRKSPLSKELFYYPEQVKMNKEIEDRIGELKKLEYSQLYHVKSLREGRKEQIDLSIGSKYYLKINCVEKIFPLNVRVQSGMGMFEIYVSKRIERPSKQNCDFSFNASMFEVVYPLGTEIEYIYFTVNALGKLKAQITMNFSARQERKQSIVVNSHRKLLNKKEMNTTKYEFFKEHMTHDEAKDFETIIEEIKKEKKMIYMGQRDVIEQNMRVASGYRQFRESKYDTTFKKRDVLILKNKEQKVVNDEQKKTKRIFQMIKSDVKRCEGEVRLQEAKQTKKSIIYNKSWITITVLFNLMKSMRERKSTVVALRIIKNIRDNNAIKVQRKVRGYIHRVLYIKHQDHLNPSESDLYTQQEAKTALHMFHAFNSLALMAKKVKVARAEKIAAALIFSVIEPAQLVEACTPFNEKVKLIQRKWKVQITKIQARAEVFIMCWNEYCNKLLEDAKSKKKVLAVFQKIRKEQIYKAARKFVFEKMKNLNRAGNIFANLHIMIQKQGTFDLTLQTPKLIAGKSSNTSKGNVSPLPPVRKNDKKKTTMMEKEKLVKQAPVVEKKEEVKDAPETTNFKYKPTAQEIKEIFAMIVEEAERESAMSP